MVLGRPLGHYQSTINMVCFKTPQTILVHMNFLTISLDPCRFLHHLGSYQSPGGNQLDPWRSQHHPKVTNPLEVINWVHVDSNIIPSLPILLGDQLGPCRFSTSPWGYQSSGAINWVDADSLHHPEVTNSLGAINWVHINSYITLSNQNANVALRQGRWLSLLPQACKY